MHKFDPKKEPATVRIEVNDRRYVRIYDGRLDDQGNETYVLLHKERTEEPVLDQEKKTVVMKLGWNLEKAQMWVPPRIATRLTMQSIVDTSMGNPPVADPSTILLISLFLPEKPTAQA